MCVCWLVVVVWFGGLDCWVRGVRVVVGCGFGVGGMVCRRGGGQCAGQEWELVVCCGGVGVVASVVCKSGSGQE